MEAYFLSFGSVIIENTLKSLNKKQQNFYEDHMRSDLI